MLVKWDFFLLSSIAPSVPQPSGPDLRIWIGKIILLWKWRICFSCRLTAQNTQANENHPLLKTDCFYEYGILSDISKICSIFSLILFYLLFIIKLQFLLIYFLVCLFCYFYILAFSPLLTVFTFDYQLILTSKLSCPPNFFIPSFLAWGYFYKTFFISRKLLCLFGKVGKISSVIQKKSSFCCSLISFVFYFKLRHFPNWQESLSL